MKQELSSQMTAGRSARTQRLQVLVARLAALAVLSLLVEYRYVAQSSTLQVASGRQELSNAAERASAAGERLRADQTAESNRRALKKYEEALSFWRAAADRRKEASTEKTIGDLLQLLNDPKKAIGRYNRALLLIKQIKDTFLEGQVLTAMGSAYVDLGENQRALGYCTTALQLLREADDRGLEADALNNIGEVHTRLGELFKALEYFQQALQLSTAINDKKRQAQAKLSLGYSYSDLGDVSRALNSYNAAVSLWREVGDRRGEALTLIALGHLRSRLGEKQEALDIFVKARSLIQAVGDRIWEGSSIAGIAYIYDGFGEKQRALEYYAQTLRIFQSISFRKGEANAFYAIGRVHQTLGENQKALKCYETGLSIVRAIGDRRLESYGLKYLGSVYDDLGERAKAMDFYERARDIYKTGGDRRGEASTLNSIGNIFFERGEHERALGCYREALSLNRETGDRFEESSTLYNIARTHRYLGSLGEGRDMIEAALLLNERFRAAVTSQTLRASYFATVRQNYELYVDLLMRSHKLQPANGLAAAALNVSERGRARSLIELLAESRADIRLGADSELLDRERALYQSLIGKEDRYARLLAGRYSEEQAAAAVREMEEIRTDYQQIQSQIRSASPRYAALTQPQPLTLKEIQEQVLDPDTLLLEYALGDERSYLWVVTPDSLNTFELPKRAEIESAARRVYDLLTAPPQIGKAETRLRKGKQGERPGAGYAHASSALTRMVLGPVASMLGTKRLLIVPDGALQYIPFAALAVPGTERVAGASGESPGAKNAHDAALEFKPLIVDHEIVSLPSASTLAVMRRELAGRKPAPKAIAVLADPVFSPFDPRVVNSLQVPGARQLAVRSVTRDFERAIKEVRVSRKRGAVGRLPFSRIEAAAIKAVAPAGESLAAIDFDASRFTATSDQLSQYRIIHFATHGLLNSEHPELSGLVFSLVDRKGKHQNGFLRLHEVYNLNLPAELVVLSACQTGLGKDVKGEGIVGLTRGFMYAGAARVMASLWQVDDAATAELMTRFYSRVLGDGLRPAAALREAQVEMWKQKRWQTPYHWAGFVLQGEWK